MGDFRTRQSFEKAFKKEVVNFDENRIWFEHPSNFSSQSKICFTWNGKLHRFPMYKTQYHIDIWKNHFIEFLNTGEFDYNGYWQIYNSWKGSDRFIGEVLKFPMHKGTYEFFDVHSPEMNSYLSEYRKTDKGCGIQLVLKPIVLPKKVVTSETIEETEDETKIREIILKNSSIWIEEYKANGKPITDDEIRIMIDAGIRTAFYKLKNKITI